MPCNILTGYFYLQKKPKSYIYWKEFLMKKKNTGTIDAAAEMYKNTLKQVKEGKQRKLIKDLKGTYLNQHHKENILSPDVEYQRINRWTLNFPKKFNISPWFIKSVIRPSYPFDGDFNVEIYEGVYEPNGLIEFLKIQQKDGFKLKLELLDPTGVVIEKWVIKNCFIKAVHWCPLNYKDDGPTTITLCLSYEKIKFKTK